MNNSHIIKGNSTNDLDEQFVEDLTIEMEKIYNDQEYNSYIRKKLKIANEYYQKREEYSTKIVKK